MYNTVIFTDTTDNICGIPALGSYKCAHVLRKHGYSCLVVNHLSDYSYQELTELIDKIIDHDTFLVGFSNSFFRSTEIERDPSNPNPPYPYLHNDLVFPQGKEFEDLIISYIKNKNKNIKFVVGGARVGTNFKNRNIDYACIGYSEISLVNLAQYLDNKTSLMSSYKNLFGVIIIDDRTAPTYDFANENMEWLPTDIVNHQCLPIEIGRGCIFKCKFCAYPLNGKKKLDFIKRSDLLQQELQTNFDKYGITTYQIVDDTFNDNETKLDMILDSIKQLTFKPNFWAYTRLDLLHLKPHTIDRLYQIGMRAFYFGIETTHPAAGKVIGKGFDFEKLNSTIKHIRHTYPDVTMHGSFIIGLPHESVEHVTNTFDRVCSQDIPLHSWRFSPLMLKDRDASTFESEFSLNYQKYGYEKISSIGENTGTIVSVNPNTTINWKNQFMTWDIAVELSNQFTRKSISVDDYKLEGTLIFPLADMGLNLDTLIETPKKSFDFNYIENTVRPNFIKDYKLQLLQLID